MNLSPEQWLAELFAFELCEECGGDSEDHEVCVVPGTETFFARCILEGDGTVIVGNDHETD